MGDVSQEQVSASLLAKSMSRLRVAHCPALHDFFDTEAVEA